MGGFFFAGGSGPVSAVEWVLGVAFWGALLFLLVRFPGRTVGVAVALGLWPVLGPWATWLVLGLTVVGAVLWRHAGPAEQYGLLAYPAVAVVVASGAVALLAGGRAGRVALVVAVAMCGWLAATWVPRIAVTVRGLRRLVGRVVGRGLRALRPVVSLVRCEHCAGDVVVVTRPEAAASGASDVAATGTCSGCGARWVAVTDPATGGLVWSPMPAGGELTTREGLA